MQKFDQAPVPIGVADHVSKVFENPLLGTFSTIAELGALLNTALGTMEPYSRYSFRVTATASVSPFDNTYIYYGMLYKNPNSNYCFVELFPNAAEYIIVGNVLTDSTWTFSRVASKYPYDNTFVHNVVPTGTNLDTIVEPGSYKLSSAYTYTNKPSSECYDLIVYRPSASSAMRLQVAFGTTHMYIRQYSGSAWLAWKTFTEDSTHCVNKTAFPDLTGITSKATLDAVLDGYLSSMVNLSSYQFSFNSGGSFNGFASGEAYYCTLYKRSSTTYTCATFLDTSTRTIIKGHRDSSGWHYEEVITMVVQEANVGSEGIKAFKTGNTVFVSFENYKATSDHAADSTIATLASGWRPAYQAGFLDTLTPSRRIYISTSGAIVTKTAITNSGSIRGSITFLASV